jgi:hypothetical protein
MERAQRDVGDQHWMLLEGMERRPDPDAGRYAGRIAALGSAIGAERLGIGHDRVASLTKSLVRAHTAAPALAIEPFVRGDELSDGNVLIVSVGAGISVAAATYQHR